MTRSDSRAGVAKRLKALIDRSGGVRAFAAELDISSSLVSSYRHGRCLPNSESLKKIAETTGVSVDWLLFGDGGESPVMRGQTRSEATLAEDVAEHVRREALRLVGGPALSLDGEQSLDVAVSGRRLLREAAQQVARNYHKQAKSLEAIRTALQPVAEAAVKSKDQSGREVFDRAVAAAFELRESLSVGSARYVSLRDPGAYIPVPLPIDEVRELGERAIARLNWEHGRRGKRRQQR
jgi:transcriptional regulator with XRE-family HTH domain